MYKSKTLCERVLVFVVFLLAAIALLTFSSHQVEASTVFTVSGTPSAYIPTTSYYVDGSEGLGSTYAYTSSSTFTPTGIAFKGGKAGGSDASVYEARLIDYTTGTNYDWDFTPADQSFDLYERTSTPNFISGGNGSRTINAGEPFYIEIIGYGPSSAYFGSVDSTDKGVWFSTAGATGFTPPASTFYAKITNATSTGYLTLRDSASTSGNPLKTLPNDWILQVASTTDSSGNPIIANGYQWYQVTDPTDGVTGWMVGKDASDTIPYLPYDPSSQTTFEGTSSTYVATSSRPNIVLAAFDHYYNDTSTTSSLYSSDDSDSADGNNDISIFKSHSFPKELMWGIAAREDGPLDTNGLNNEIVSYDYGHGVMQNTFNAWGYEHFDGISTATWDNRGRGSQIKIPDCAAISSSDYLNCYQDAGTGNYNLKAYKQYGSVTYKEYSNTIQSVYANIKDGLKTLQEGFYDACAADPSNQTLGSYTYTCNDRQNIITTANYNGSSTYLTDVANRLNNITETFPDATTSDIADLIPKMIYASDHSIYIQLHSPGDLRIEGPNGETLSIDNGKVTNTFPFASYDPYTKSAHIFFVDPHKLTYKVVGSETGTYGFELHATQDGQKIDFFTTKMPMIPGEIDTYTLSNEAGRSGTQGISLTIDKNGNGVIDSTGKFDATITGESYIASSTSSSVTTLAK